ncbi:MAG: VIT domain-containing protein [Capsulimonadaceae bacterium]
MQTLVRYILVLAAAAVLFGAASARADDEDPFGFDTSLNIYTESPYSKLPLKSVHSSTRIEGAIAQTHIEYTFIDGMTQTMEVGLNFKLPDGAILNGFGYYYGSRYITGKIYDNDQAWQIYTAVTSHGRDPGIMDRPSQQDYHTQIFPVLPGQYLRVDVDLTQIMPTDEAGAHFTLPLQQSSEVTRTTDIDAHVTVVNCRGSLLTSSDPAHTTTTSDGASASMRLTGNWLPRTDWVVTIARALPGVKVSAFSRLPASGKGTPAHGSRRGALGAYAATISCPWALNDVRIKLSGRPRTSMASATRFGDVDRYGTIGFCGRYRRAGREYVTVRSSNHRPFTVSFELGSGRTADPENPAARVWADKRISALQDSPRDRRTECVALSRRYTVVSNFTALLAIPKEELENYKRHMAADNADTNTQYTGGGGGDPYIWVNAPSDARQVVAVFPDGDAQNLTFDTNRKTWSTRFDIPLGMPAGTFDVTIIVVMADGARSRFVIEYDNLTRSPSAAVAGGPLSAVPGGMLTVRVDAGGATRATLVAPWAEREPMTEGGPGSDGSWSGALTVPTDWQPGTVPVTVVLYDGAHDRSEVTVDVSIR